MARATERSGSDAFRATRERPGHRARVLALAALAALVLLGAGTPAGNATPPAVDDGVVPQVGQTANLTVAPNPAHPGETVTLDARGSTSEESTVESCEFDADDDGAVDATEETCVAEWTYREVGDYAATVRVRFASGETATATAEVRVRANRPPVPVVGIDPPEPRAGEQVGLSATDSVDPDGRIVESAWRLPDRTFEGETAAVRFPDPGEYELTLVVTDDDGLSNETTTVVRVGENRSPAASLSVATTEPRAGEPIELDASAASDPDGRLVEYRWDLDGDGAVDRVTETPGTTVIVDRAGTRRLAVTVVDDGGATATDAVEVEVGTTGAAAGTATAALPDASDGDAPESAGGPLAALDFGIAPIVPDWLAVLLLAVAVAGAGTAWRHRRAVHARIQGVRDRLTRGDVRRRIATKASGTATKTAAKRVLRAVADGIEGGGRALGNGLERLGGAIERWSERVAAALRRLGG